MRQRAGGEGAAARARHQAVDVGSKYWLKAPALAEDTSTDSASTSDLQPGSGRPRRDGQAGQRGDHDDHADAQLEHAQHRRAASTPAVRRDRPERRACDRCVQDRSDAVCAALGRQVAAPVAPQLRSAQAPDRGQVLPVDEVVQDEGHQEHHRQHEGAGRREAGRAVALRRRPWARCAGSA